MHLAELEIYSSDSNYAIIKAPNRKFPGVLIQGDTLRVLCQQVQTIALAMKETPNFSEELLSTVEDLQEGLLNRLLHYQNALLAHNIDLPYFASASADDFVQLLRDDMP